MKELKEEKKSKRIAVLEVACALLVPLIFGFIVLLLPDKNGRMFTLLNGAALCVCMLSLYFMFFRWSEKNMIEDSKPEEDGLVVTDPKGKMKDCKNKNMLFIGSSGSGKTNPWCMPQLNLKPCPCGCETTPFLMFEKNNYFFAGEELYVVNAFVICGMCGRHTKTSNVLTAVYNWNNDIYTSDESKNNGWISSDEPPKESGEYNVTISGATKATSLRYDANYNIWYGEIDECYTVSAWQPLPKAYIPKEKKIDAIHGGKDITKTELRDNCSLERE